MKSSTKLTLIILGVFVLVCCGGPLLFFMRFSSGSSGLASGIRAYRAAGLPWTQDELMPVVPSDQDAGPQLSAAFKRLELLHASNADQEILDALDAGDTKGAAAKLAPFSPSIDVVVEAIRRPHATFGKDWDLGPSVLFPEMATSKAAAKLLCDRAVIKAKDGQFESSNTDLAAAWELGDRVGEEPTLIGMLVQISERAIVMRGVERCIPFEVSRPEALKALQATVSKMDTPLDVQRAIRGEAYMQLSIVRNLSYYGPQLSKMADDGGAAPPIDPSRLRRTGDPSGIYASLLGGSVLRNSARLANITAADRNDPTKLEADFGAFDSSIEKEGPLSGLLAKLLEPVYNGAGKAITRSIATKRITQALLEGLVMKSATGQYPKTVGDLPTRWINPANGKPIGMRVSVTSLRFYVPGPDGGDYGGRTAAETGNDREYDIVAGYPTPLRKTSAIGKRPKPRTK